MSDPTEYALPRSAWKIAAASWSTARRDARELTMLSLRAAAPGLLSGTLVCTVVLWMGGQFTQTGWGPTLLLAAGLAIIFCATMLARAAAIEFYAARLAQAPGAYQSEGIVSSRPAAWPRRLLATVPAWLAVQIGFEICVLPGVYLMVPMAVLPAAVLLRADQTLQQALNETFKLIARRWWFVFKAVALFDLVAIGVGFILVVPGIYLGHGLGLMLDDGRLMRAFCILLFTGAGFSVLQAAMGIFTVNIYRALFRIRAEARASAAAETSDDESER